MRRLAGLIVVGLLTATACSAGDGSGPEGGLDGAPASTVAEDDPAARFCAGWSEFETLMESDREPTDELIDELLDRQRGIEEVLPDELAPAWADITGWTSAFIEFFSAAGYQEIDDETLITVFGDEQSAEDAANALGAAFTTMHEWSARNCTTGEGDAAAFCTAWTDISALHARLDEEPPTAATVDELFAAYDAAAPDVPAEIRDDWDAMMAFAVPFRDVLVTVEFDVDRISDDLVTQAFGDVDTAEALEQAAERGRAAIDAWSLEGCGGFCTRWGETREAIEMLGHDLAWVVDMGSGGERQLGTMQARLDLVSQQVPDEIAADWDLLMAVIDDWVGWWESFDFDHEQLFGPDGRAAAAAIARQAPYLPDFVIAMERPPDADVARVIADLPRRPDDDLASVWQGAVEYAVRTTTERLDAWFDESCGAAGGLPGRVRVSWPTIDGAAGSAIVLAVMPPGSTLEDLGDIDARAAGFCESVGRDPWGVEVDPEGRQHHWDSEWFRSEPAEGQGDTLCEFAWEQDPAVLQPGPYTLLAALVPGGIQGITLPGAPTACAALDIVIDGDTVVELPSLAACDADLSDLVIASDPWRAPEPVDPTTPGAGTLRVTIESLVLPEGIESIEGGELTIIVLPSGTTLNSVGREQVWPSGGLQQQLEPRGTGQLAQVGAVALPIMAVPPTGIVGSLDPWWLTTATPAQLPLVVLAPGDYDVYVEIIGHSDRPMPDRRCGHTSVTIDGDTIIEMPDLGACP